MKRLKIQKCKNRHGQKCSGPVENAGVEISASSCDGGKVFFRTCCINNCCTSLHYCWLITGWAIGQTCCTMPKAHRRGTDADATQLSSWVASASAVCIEFATVHDRFGRKLIAEHVENLSSRVGCRIIGNWITTADGWVHTSRHNSIRLNVFSFQFF